ncbi:MAG: hypothetical protein H7146_09460 [Burkholderiaceae bacterium]|nr:hypothetical protein [Microbacteriaceae bacterium]
MGSSIRTRIFGLLLLVVFGTVGTGSFLSGIALDGMDPASVQCLSGSPRPGVGGPYRENAAIDGQFTFFPLGVTCVFDSPDDSVGPQTVANGNWPATFLWAGSTVVALSCATVLIRPGILTGAGRRR